MRNLIANISIKEIAKFCQRWKIRELALFGSALRDDFGPDSDLDILIDFDVDAEWGLLEHVQMQQELQTLLHRNVDLISKRGLEYSQNWLRRQEILNTTQILFSKTEAAHAKR
jgi:predicted nucleotidyltransferase